MAKQKSLTITIGGDPEFGLLHSITKSQLYARKYYSGTHVGCDGHNDIGELRTSGGYNCPLLYVAELCNLITTTLNAKTPQEAILVGGSMVKNDPIGGHIHIGCKENSRHIRDQIIPLVNALDLFVAVPSLMIEDFAKSSFRRSHSGYGKLSASKETSWGIEYRTLPSWLVSKGFATSLLSLAFIVADHAVNCELPPVFSDLGTKAKQHFYKSDRKYFYRYLPKIFKYAKKMRLYNKYALPINSLFGFIKCFNHIPLRMWTAEKDFFPKWGVDRSKAKTPTNEVTYDIAFNEASRSLTEIVNGTTNRYKWKLSKKIAIYSISNERVRDNDDTEIEFYGCTHEDMGSAIGAVGEESSYDFEWRKISRDGIPLKYRNADMVIGISHRLRDHWKTWLKQVLSSLLNVYFCRTAVGGHHYCPIIDSATRQFYWA